MTQILTIVARIEAQEGKADFVKAEMLKLLEPTRKEVGCIQYDLHQDNDNPHVFVFHEQWKSEVFLQDHLNTAHIAEYVKAVDGSITSFVLNRMTKL
ncbi:putative quinol monooxygenase [Aliivibrio sp. S4TY2]|uniref:putative quinol monooxygenase n=1 Tax=unclassified Aliivibrio TaxID=2645654 RepID=UPI002377E0A6|nr:MULTISPECIES: putative quinol monooxygenase [unclassified Aliivibrio]MDD9157600.1 putative quinol monooxygenase [Aliivibrio sp. S4TY2]MDD9161437.1 putative quinol monooxygenase [Aliivibrio sp. S4TY1]MDD9165510.1 putative quinol monooxygenase [Aliivibrio sp. S4MY2]MDD9169466.1 putative quinol monooxygenase [Aliivibrio sp. S4MY4]MDD9186459.1 putative quinol monooxygenase [Aliivibrio sp. S4MY3]